MELENDSVTTAAKITLTVETGASDIATAAPLNQNGRSVGCFWNIVSNGKKTFFDLKKHIVEALKKGRIC